MFSKNFNYIGTGQFCKMIRKTNIQYVRLIRRNFATYKADKADYVNRKILIQKEGDLYYPPLKNIRDEKFKIMRVGSFRDRFETEEFSRYENNRFPEAFCIEGRITSIRRSGKAMYFIDLIQDDTKIQILASNKLLNISREDFDQHHTILRKGDYISCVGYPSRTQVGELSLKLIKKIEIVSPCLSSTKLPQKIIDKQIINSNRVLNYLVSHESKQKLLARSNILQATRQFFMDRGFVEVQTPIMSGLGTGANAEPFKTVSNVLSSTSEKKIQELQLRVAPELWLKKLIIGGFDKIFEIGPNFRNEGIDSTHNPEFTSCEFYQTFTDLDELMNLTEDFFEHLYLHLESKNIPIVHERLSSLQSFKEKKTLRYEFIPTLEKITGKELPLTLDTKSLLEYYDAIGLSRPPVLSSSSLLDKLSATYLEPLSESTDTPVIIFNQPEALSPLAKSMCIKYGKREYKISLRFELFIRGKEYVNSYEEENSPVEQAQKFKDQVNAGKEFNDVEMIIPDWPYVKSLEYGLPPTGGWGCGIDRICMLFTGAQRVEEVLSFGTVKDVLKQ